MDDILSQIIAYAPDRIDTETKARALVQGPRNMYAGGQLVSPSVDGSRPGYQGPKKVQLTTDMIIDIAEKNPDWTASNVLEYFQKDKTKNYVTRHGTPINRGSIQGTLSANFDLAAEKAGKVPEGYISSAEVFENLPISKKDYFRVKQAKKGGTLLTQEIDRLLKPQQVGAQQFYFKKPSKSDMKSFNRLADKTGRLNNRIANLMIEFDTAYGDKFFSKGNIPDIKNVAKKFNITDSTAGKVTSRLAQWYGGQDFKNPQLQDIKRNKVTSNRMFKTIEKSAFGNPYRDGLYQISMQTIDAKLGNKQGTFEKFKSQAKNILKKNNIPVYDPKMGKNAFGFNINEIAGITGSAKSKAAEFSQFVDVMEGNLNTKTMAGFQSKLSTARDNIEKAKGTKNYKNVLSSESKRINDMAIRLEKQHGVDLPRLRDPDATKYFSPKRLKELEDQGLDIVKAAERAGYTIEMPKGSKTISEFTSEVKNLNKADTMKLLKKMGYRCRKEGGGGESVACYMDDVKKTRADLKSQDVTVRAMARTKQRNALKVASKLPQIGKIIKTGVQFGTAAITKPLQWLGLTSGLGYAIEGIVEGGFYDNARRKGYNHEQAMAETLTPGLVLGRPEGVPWYGGSEKLREKELYTQTDPREFVYFDGKEFKNPNFGKPTGKIDSKVKQYTEALKDQDRIYDAFARKEMGKAIEMDQLTGTEFQRKDILDKASADIRDLAKTGTMGNVNRIINPESMASQAYNTAVEKRDALDQRRRKEYLEKYDPRALEHEKRSFDIYYKDKEGRFLLNDKGEKIEKPGSLYKKRYKEMEKYKDGRKSTFGFMSPKDWEKYQTTFPKYKNIPYEHPQLPKFADYVEMLKTKPEGFDKTYRELFPTPASRYSWDLTGKVARAGGVANMATGGRAGYSEGGITGLRSKYEYKK